ncbi:MAG: alkaline phosphatase [Cytophagaceae bacterium SCN 52-12]|nr:MAG: alkaline phosphatase [Cytophagaceae bacterium SCN 52-12]
MKNENRRTFVKKAGIGIVASLSLSDIPAVMTGSVPDRPEKQEVFFTTGFKAAEVTTDSVILWTRLCGQEKPNPVVHRRREAIFRHPIDFDEEMPVGSMDGGVKGIGGSVKVQLSGGGQILESEWHSADTENDFTVRIPFDRLKPATSYRVTWTAKLPGSDALHTAAGTFRTAPQFSSPDAVRLVTSTCQYFWSYDHDERGFRIYDSMRRLNPDFFVHTGDYVYYDKPGPLGTTIEKARHQWHAMDGWPSLVDFYKGVPVYMTKDDHDLLRDDVHPFSPAYGQLTFGDGLKLWRENAPIAGKPYRTFRWGRHLQIWLMEGREYRSSNQDKDSASKTIWGEEQKKWLLETVAGSDATFRLLFSPTPVVGPDRDRKTDNHANKAFETEGNWLREYLSAQENMFVVNGDRHWQYVSVDKKTGLTEFGSGPVSDAHAQGWDQEDVRPEHKFLRVKGGFLEIAVVPSDRSAAVIKFIHRDVDGNPVHEEAFSSS